MFADPDNPQQGSAIGMDFDIVSGSSPVKASDYPVLAGRK